MPRRRWRRQPPVAEGAVLRRADPPAGRRIFCVGKNYTSTRRSSPGPASTRAKDEVPEAPVVFTKRLPRSSARATIPSSWTAPAALDYEGELAVVIGTGGAASQGRRAEHVFGYTIVNDVTARTCSLAPAMVARQVYRRLLPDGPGDRDRRRAAGPDDAAGHDPVNGEMRQDAPVADLIFDIPTLIETISAAITLEPGDIIATGTPAGVGIGFNPPRPGPATWCGSRCRDRRAGKPVG